VVATGGGRALAEEIDIPFLGSVPLDPRIGMACDYGESFFDSYGDSPACKALKGMVRGLAAQLKLDSKQVMPNEP
jgi:Flp pilus assembly CpaE family ATPase